MAYSDFTLESCVKLLGVSYRPGAQLFSELLPVTPPVWLPEQLARGLELPLINEKTRSELIVMPILLAAREVCHKAFAIYSGATLNVDAERGLVGECDFILTATPPEPLVTAPVVALVEAKRGDIELALGQCIAQMVASRIFNEREGKTYPAIFGCVTTGETWQFLKLEDNVLSIERTRNYISDVAGILAVFLAIARVYTTNK